jgi:hypothetical protein
MKCNHSSLELETNSDEVETQVEDEAEKPCLMLSIKTLAGYLPTIHLKPDATVADLADVVVNLDPNTYSNSQLVFIRAHADGSSEELEDESRQLSSIGLQCDVEEELVLVIVGDLNKVP